MKIAYLDCFAGISGDMFLGALVAAGLDLERLIEAFEQTPVTRNMISASLVDRMGIRAVKMDVLEEAGIHGHGCDNDHDHDHDNDHDHDHDHDNDNGHGHGLEVEEIREIIWGSGLEESVIGKAIEAFDRIVEAESKIHGVPIDHVHLHEVSAIDTIVDILGVSYGIHALNIDRLVASPLEVGSGMIRISHGEYPVPAPATAEILKGIPVTSGNLPGERVTPTGAALVKTFVSEFGPAPAMTIRKIGYGAGSRTDGNRPNVLKITIGDSNAKQTGPTESPDEALVMIETNIDDQSPEQLAHACEGIRTIEGVLDVMQIPGIMKKGRNGILVRVLSQEAARDAVCTALLAETTTLGVRWHSVSRRAAVRRIETVEVAGCEIRVKIAADTVAPEFEDCREASRKSGRPVKSIFLEAIRICRQT